MISEDPFDVFFGQRGICCPLSTRVLEDMRDGICVQRPHIKDNIFSGLGILFVHPHTCRWT